MIPFELLAFLIYISSPNYTAKCKYSRVSIAVGVFKSGYFRDSACRKNSDVILCVNHVLGVVRLGYFREPGCCSTTIIDNGMLSYEKRLVLASLCVA